MKNDKIRAICESDAVSLLEDTFGMPRRKSLLAEATPESKCTDERLYVISCIDSVITREHCVNLFSARKE